jgi:hypothetical protein
MHTSSSSMVRVVPPSGDNPIKFKIIMASKICGTAHLIPDVPISSTEINTGWVINNHIDLIAWNTVYYVYNISKQGKKRLRSEK